MQLKDLISQHVKETGSPKGTYILEHFSEYLPKFKKIIPYDYQKMLQSIALMEEKGFEPKQALIEAFYAQKGRMKNG